MTALGDLPAARETLRQMGGEGRTALQPMAAKHDASGAGVVGTNVATVAAVTVAVAGAAAVAGAVAAAVAGAVAGAGAAAVAGAVVGAIATPSRADPCEFGRGEGCHRVLARVIGP